MCEHSHDFWVIECDKFVAKKQKRLQKRGFWSKLLGSKPSCEISLMKESKYLWCPFCTRAQNLEYASDHYGNDIDAADSETQPSDKRNLREELLSGGPSRQNLKMPDMPRNLRNSFLELSSSQRKDKPGEQLPATQSSRVDPGIEFKRGSHVRDHVIPPRSGPPPSKPLPPIPPARQQRGVQKQQVPASQGRQRDLTGKELHRKPVAGPRGERYPTHNNRELDGPEGPISPLFARPPTRRKETPLPLILDKDRELPEFPWLLGETDPVSPLTASFLQNEESSGQEPATRVRRGDHGTNRSRRKPNQFQSSPVPPLIPDTDSSTPYRVDGPNRRAQTISGRHEHIRSEYGDLAYISPRLKERIDDVENYWAGGVRQSKDGIDMRKRAETEHARHKERANRIPGRKVKFDETVRNDSR